MGEIQQIAMGASAWALLAVLAVACEAAGGRQAQLDASKAFDLLQEKEGSDLRKDIDLDATFKAVSAVQKRLGVAEWQRDQLNYQANDLMEIEMHMLENLKTQVLKQKPLSKEVADKRYQETKQHRQEKDAQVAEKKRARSSSLRQSLNPPWQNTKLQPGLTKPRTRPRRRKRKKPAKLLLRPKRRTS